MVRHLLLVAVVLPAVAAAAPVPKGLKAKSLDGTWEVVEQHSRGNKVTSRVQVRWTIDEEKLTVDRYQKGQAVILKQTRPLTYTLTKPDPARSADVDYTISYSDGRTPVTYHGRLEVEGDTLRFCYEPRNNGERPAECKPTETNVYFEFRRVTADGKDK
jgi:uncharacterized protein (TIGR03067 family)